VTFYGIIEKKWGAEGALARKDNPSIKIFFSAEGMNIWQDNILFPGVLHKKTFAGRILMNLIGFQNKLKLNINVELFMRVRTRNTGMASPQVG
jgi:hypothetical protein